MPRPAVSGGRSNQPSRSEITLMCKGRQAARVPDRNAEKRRGLKNEKHYSVSLRCRCMRVPCQVLRAIHSRLES